MGTLKKFIKPALYYAGITALIALYVWARNKSEQSYSVVQGLIHFMFVFWTMLIWPFYTFQYLDGKWGLLIAWWQDKKSAN